MHTRPDFQPFPVSPATRNALPPHRNTLTRSTCQRNDVTPQRSCARLEPEGPAVREKRGDCRIVKNSEPPDTNRGEN